jgi:hypothetical protein
MLTSVKNISHLSPGNWNIFHIPVLFAPTPALPACREGWGGSCSAEGGSGKILAVPPQNTFNLNKIIWFNIHSSDQKIKKESSNPLSRLRCSI